MRSPPTSISSRLCNEDLCSSFDEKETSSIDWGNEVESSCSDESAIPPPPPPDELDRSDCTDLSSRGSINNEYSQPSFCRRGPECSLARSISYRSDQGDGVTHCVTREDSKDESSEIGLETLRFDYSNLSSEGKSDVDTGPTQPSPDVTHGMLSSGHVNQSAGHDDEDISPYHYPRATAGALRIINQVLEIFALRCTFDHWRCETICGKDDASLSSQSSDGNDSIVSYNMLTRNAFDAMERVVRISVKRSVFSTLRSSVYRWRRCKMMLENLDSMTQQMVLRIAMTRWANVIQQISWQNAIVRTRNVRACQTKSRQILLSWRDIAATEIELRQRVLLMIIFNRWRIYAEECIELRQLRYKALVHWATFKCKKVFEHWRRKSKQSKEEKKYFLRGAGDRIGHNLGCQMAFYNPNAKGAHHAATRFVTPSKSGTWPSSSNKASFKSPIAYSTSRLNSESMQSSVKWNRTPDQLQHAYARSSSFGGRRSSEQLGNFPPGTISAPLTTIQSYPSCNDAKPHEATQRAAARYDLPRTKHSHPLITECPTTKTTPITCRVPRPSMFASAGYDYSSYRSNSQLRFSYTDQQKREPMYDTLSYGNQTLQPTHLPSQHSYSASRFQSQNSTFTAPPSVKRIRDYYQERFTVANLLDDLVSEVERRLYLTRSCFHNHHGY